MEVTERMSYPPSANTTRSKHRRLTCVAVALEWHSRCRRSMLWHCRRTAPIVISTLTRATARVIPFVIFPRAYVASTTMLLASPVGNSSVIIVISQMTHPRRCGGSSSGVTHPGRRGAWALCPRAGCSRCLIAFAVNRVTAGAIAETLGRAALAPAGPCCRRRLRL